MLTRSLPVLFFRVTYERIIQKKESLLYPNPFYVAAVVQAVVEGGAAWQDGRLEAGDQLLAVDGHSLEGITQVRDPLGLSTGQPGRKGVWVGGWGRDQLLAVDGHSLEGITQVRHSPGLGTGQQGSKGLR